MTLRARLERAQAVRASAEADLEELKDQIVTVLGHEIRTPLTYIRGYTDLAKEDLGALSREQLEIFLQGISRGSDRLNRLAEDFLILIRVDAGQIAAEYRQLTRPRYDLSDVIGRVICRQQSLHVDPAVTIENLVEPDLPPVELHEQFFCDALDRLIDNAVKFSVDADKRVVVDARREGDLVKIAVIDDGVGIRSEEIHHLFERFRQVDRRTLEQQGLGLGLAIANELIDQHHGRITVKSVYGEGSTFTIELPVLGKDWA